MPREIGALGVEPLTNSFVDRTRDGRLYAATRMGVQVLDRNGRSRAVMQLKIEGQFRMEGSKAEVKTEVYGTVNKLK